ncbi:MAG: hypothetical protein B6U94_01185 [Thermofilum sp. ex4484_79]|nr:MAG: hypothetical protein B6U94_01185 [Thermofilum sp. ex4484_79]
MPVKYYRERITMQTYRILDEDPLPRFFRYYPYTGLNNFDDKPVPVEYDSIVAENEYLKMRVIPSLGARLYDLYDKVNKVHVFHYNEIVRPTMIAIRGAWVATGIEFNCLHRPHHTVDNFSPVDYKVVKREDGSVTVYIGNINLITNIYYLIGLTLRPGRQFLETHIKIFNNDQLRTRYYFWTNTAESVTDMSRIFIPGKRTQAGPFPVFKGVDVSWYRNCKYSVDAFVIDCEEDFFGYYDYKMERGVVQYANHFQVPGKKRFTWGTSEDGLFWAPILSDKGIPYIELQSGRFRTQGIVEFIDPHFYEEWKEWWYPIAKIGGISFANKDATVYVDHKKQNGKYKVFIGIYVTKEFPRSRIIVRCGNKVVEETFDLSPDNPFIKEYVSENDKVEVKVLDKDNKEVIFWDCRDYKTKVDESVFLVPAEFASEREEKLEGGRSLEKLLVDATIEDKRGRSLLAELKYKNVLKLDEYCSRALCYLAILYYRQGRYRDAIKLLEKAVKVNPSFEDTHYYLGLSYLRLNDYFNSEIELWKARISMKFFSPASYHIALINVRRKEYERAEEILKEITERNSKDMKSLFLYIVVLRKLGKLNKALEIAKKTLDMFPFYYPILSEWMLCAKGTEEYEEAKSEFKRIVLAKDQKVLEVAKEYMNAELFEEAEDVLKMAISSGIDTPMIHYYLGFVYEKTGRLNERDKEYKIGNSKNPDYIFPHRLEEIEILESVENATGNPKPSYYLGNLLFYLRRFKEAVKEWEEAREKGLRYSILYRNLGYAYYTVYRDAQKALEMYKEAIRLDPLNYRLYLEYDEVCAWLGLTSKRIRTLEDARKKIRKDSILAKLSSAYVDAGKYDAALEILTTNTFTPAEGYYGYWNIYVEALIRRGVEKMEKGELKEALEDFLSAFKYPSNLGVGAPYPPRRHEAMQRYWLGECYLALGEKEKALKVWNEIFIQERLTPIEEYYKGLILKKLGKEEEAKQYFEDILLKASQREKKIIKFKKSVPPEYFIFLNYDKQLALCRCIKATAYLGLMRNEEALKEFRKARRITKDLGHYNWIYNSHFSKRVQ